MKPMLKSVAACAALCGFAAVAQAKTTSDYVQTGLVAMWDAFENAGRGLHVDATNEWTDLVSGRTLALLEGDAFDGCQINLAKGVRATADKLFESAGDITIEVNARPVTLSSGYDMALVSVPNFARFGWDARDGGISIMYVNSAGTTENHYQSFASGYGNGQQLTQAGVFQTYSALIGIGSGAVYVNGSSRGKTGGVDWSGNQRSADLNAQVGNGSAVSLVRTIRIYNRKLTAEEIAANRAVDMDRFDNGNYFVKASLKGSVSVVGTPTEVSVEVQNPESGWTAEWSTDGGTTYSAERPAFSEKGVYEVRCRVSASGYAPAEVSAQVVVAPKAVKLISGSVRAGADPMPDFVALVRLSEDLTPGFKSVDLASGGADLRFFDDAGRTIPYEIDTWATDADPAGTNLVWVLIPELTPTATFYATWGYKAGDALPANDPTAVWKDYVAVWHLNEPSGTCYDATGRGTDAAVPEGYEETSVATNETPFGGAARVAPAEGVYLTAPDYTGKVTLPDSYLYVSGWFKISSVGYNKYPSLWAKRAENVGYGCNFQANATEITVVGNGTGYVTHGNLGDLTKAGWVRVTAVYLVGGWEFFYLNGNNKGGNGTPSIGDTTGIPVRLGGVKGAFDELRIKWAGPDRVAGKAQAKPVEQIEQAEWDQVMNATYYTQIGLSDDKSKIASAITGSAVQRTVTVNGAMTAIGADETTVQLVCGDTLVGEPMTVTEIGPFSLVADVSALIGFDTNSVFAVRMVSGENIVTTGTVEVKPIDTAVYTWTQGGDDDEWCNPANWSTPTPDRKDYPQNETAAARFVSSSAEEPWQVHLDRSVSIGDVILTNGNVHAVIRADSTAQQLRMRPAGSHFLGESNVIAFATVKLIPDRVTSGNANIYLGMSATQCTLVLDSAVLESWNEIYVHDLVLENSTYNSSGGLHVESGDVVVDDSTLTAGGIVLYGKIKDGVARGGHLTFRGAGAKVTTTNIQTYYKDADICGEVRFEIPEGGFMSSPVMDVTQTGTKFFDNSAPSYVSVDPESPIFAAGVKTPLEQRLICAAGGFNSSRITVRELPKRIVRAGSAFYWMENGQRYEEIADTRKDLYLTVATPKPGMKVLLK